MTNRRTIGAVILNESLSSTNLSSPLRRKSLAAAPNTPKVQKQIIQNDDESEILARQRQRIPLEISKSSENTDRRPSLGLSAGLSPNEIIEHYNKCIKLCAENKINSKNVFALSIIDYMAVTNKRDMDNNNMQVSGTRLDATTKIYGVRVDCVYSDVYKMATGPEQRDKNGKNGESDDVGNTTNNEEPVAKEKKKRAPQENECSEESLASKTETLNLSSEKKDSDSQTTDMLVQVTHPMHVIDRYSLHLYQDVLFELPTNETNDDEEMYSDLKIPDLEDLMALEICPALLNFSFIGWSEADIPAPLSPPPTPENGNVQFDLNASVGDNNFDVDNTGTNYFDLKDASQENIDQCGRMGGGMAEKIIDFRGSVNEEKKDKPATYSYLQKSIGNFHWAGPVHWRPKLVSQIISSSKIVGSCRQEGMKKKKEMNLEYSDAFGMKFFDKIQRKIPRRLQNKTVRHNWQEDKLTLPVDIHYHISNPLKLYLHSTRVKPLIPKTRSEDEVSAVSDDALPEDGANYDYNNLNDTQDYCSQNNAESKSECNGFENGNEDNQEVNGDYYDDVFTQGFTGQNLVTAPKSVTQSQIHYCTKAKKIDMRQLKKSIWKSLTLPNGTVGGQANCEDSEAGSIKEVQDFSTVYKTLPHFLGKDNTESLSLPLAFASLLHLANEKILSITFTPDLSDLKISQG